MNNLIYVLVHVWIPDWETGELADQREFSSAEEALVVCKEENDCAKYGYYIVEVRDGNHACIAEHSK